MNEQQSESLLDTLLSTEQDTDAAIIAEITKIRHAECSHSEMLNMLAALVRRTNHPAAIAELDAFCDQHGKQGVATADELLKIAAELADHPMNNLTLAEIENQTPAFFAALALHDEDGRSAEEIERAWKENKRLHEETGGIGG
jgi:hypothetical protein